MVKSLNLINQEFGLLTVLKREENDKHGKSRWKCICSCGNEKTVNGQELIKGDTRSCGCLRGMIARIMVFKCNPGKDVENEYYSITYLPCTCDRKPFICKCLKCGFIKNYRHSRIEYFFTHECFLNLSYNENNHGRPEGS